MKILIFICFSLFSSFSYAVMEINICYDGATGVTDVCGNSTQEGGDVDGTGTSTVAGVWDSTTHSCSNGVSPVADSFGNLTCPAFNPTVVNVSPSQVDPNPSKDDVACNPLDGVDGDCASQKTAIKANELASEANSKLGSIANSSATQSNLLGKILDAIKGIGSGSGSGSGGTGSGSGSDGTGSGSTTPPDDSGGAPLTNDVKTVDFSSTMGASGSCPADIQFNLLGSSYSISYSPVCDFADQIRGVVIALGAFAALSVVVTAL